MERDTGSIRSFLRIVSFFIQGISGLLPSYRRVRLSWKDFFLLLLFFFFQYFFPSNIIFPLMLHFYLLFIERMSSRVWNFIMLYPLYPAIMAIILDNAYRALSCRSHVNSIINNSSSNSSNGSGSTGSL